MRLSFTTRSAGAARTIGQCVVAGVVVYGLLTLLLFGRVFIIHSPLLQGTPPDQVRADLVDVRETMTPTGPYMSGTVVNTGQATIYGMNAMVVAFDQNDQILAVYHATAMRLRPKQSTSFEAPMSRPGMASARIMSLNFL